MTTSGTVGATVIDTAKVLEHAMRRAGVPAASQTPETIDIAKDNLFLLLSNLSNRGITLWCVDKIIMGSVVDQSSYTLPAGTIDIWNTNIRSSSRAAVFSVVSSAGGTADNLIDSDTSTYCDQTSTNGNFSFQFSAATSVISVGLKPHGTQTLALVLETSSDGSNWTGVATISSATHTNNTWFWYDIAAPKSAEYFRIRETGGGTLAMYEVFLSTKNTELPMSRENRDTYVAFPDKQYPGRPLSFWYDRTVTPSIKIWPVSDSEYYQIVVWRQRNIQDVGALTQQLEIPERWFEAVIWQLAHRMSIELPGVSNDRIEMCQQHAVQYTEEAETGERDNSPVMFNVSISGYTK